MLLLSEKRESDNWIIISIKLKFQMAFIYIYFKSAIYIQQQQQIYKPKYSVD